MCTLDSLPQGETETSPFADRLLEMLNHASLAMMLSIGHRTRLLDTMADLPASTSAEIAAATDLDERYVREWLGAMVTGRIVEYDAEKRTYRLPPEHAAFLTRAAGADNIASTMQWFSILGTVEDDVARCFREGGGVHYSAYRRFHDVMAEESSQTVVASLKDQILPLEPNLVERLEAGIDVLDIGCGCGLAVIQMAELFPRSRFTGFDFSEEAIGKARAEAKRRGVDNVQFEVQDIAKIKQVAAFDLITGFDVIHDQCDPAEVLRRVRIALRDNGTFLMQDINTSTHLEKNVDHPIGTLLYTISTMHCMTVSLAQGGAGLGTCWGKELAREMLDNAGFVNTTVRQLPHDMFNSYFIAKVA